MSEATYKSTMPILMVKPGTVSKEDIKRAFENGFVLIIENSEPAEARFIEPPIMAKIDAQARAALSLFRNIVFNGNSGSSYHRCELTAFWIKALMESSAPESVAKVKGAK